MVLRSIRVEIVDFPSNSPPRARIPRTPRATRGVREMRARGDFFFGPWLQTILRFHVCSVSISRFTSIQEPIQKT